MKYNLIFFLQMRDISEMEFTQQVAAGKGIWF
jgi:hypothetical protein